MNQNLPAEFFEKLEKFDVTTSAHQIVYERVQKIFEGADHVCNDSDDEDWSPYYHDPHRNRTPKFKACLVCDATKELAPFTAAVAQAGSELLEYLKKKKK